MCVPTYMYLFTQHNTHCTGTGNEVAVLCFGGFVYLNEKDKVLHINRLIHDNDNSGKFYSFGPPQMLVDV
jgi:hypothetical protein